jgi:hypothetical protein
MLIEKMKEIKSSFDFDLFLGELHNQASIKVEDIQEKFDL